MDSSTGCTAAAKIEQLLKDVGDQEGFGLVAAVAMRRPAAMKRPVVIKRPAVMKRPAASKRPAKVCPEVSLELDDSSQWALAYSAVSDQSELDAQAELDAREELDARRRPAWGEGWVASSPTKPSETTAAEPDQLATIMNDKGDGEKAMPSSLWFQYETTGV